jgi:hypothetical protein
MNDCVPHFFSSEEIATIMNDPIVTLNQNNLSKGMVHFSIPLSETIKAKLEKVMDVSQVTTIPMTWVRGDTLEHIDQGAPFESTFLIYLTDSVGQFIVDGQNYSITAGNAHIFSEGLSHSTLHTENDRLMMGPMSETGLPVGGIIPIIYYYSQDSDTQQPDCRIEYQSKYLNQPFQAYILNIPSPGQELNTVETDVYTAVYSNGTGLDNIWAPPTGKTFRGWKLLNKNNPVIGNNTPDKIYMPGDIFTYTQSTSLVPNWVDLPVQPVRRPFKLHFTDNSVFYKSNSLSTGSGGSGVRNYRHKQRKT